MVGTTALLGGMFNGRPVGLVECLAVHPAHRRRGLGEALAVAALHDLRERGQTEALVEIHPALTAAERLYKRLGFVPVGRGGSRGPLQKREERGASAG